MTKTKFYNVQQEDNQPELDQFNEQSEINQNNHNNSIMNNNWVLNQENINISNLNEPENQNEKEYDPEEIQRLREFYEQVIKEKYMQIYWQREEIKKRKNQNIEKLKIRNKSIVNGQETNNQFMNTQFGSSTRAKSLNRHQGFSQINKQDQIYQKGSQTCLNMPQNFEEFIFTDQYIKLIQGVREYCTDLDKIELKQKLLQNETIEDNDYKPQLLQSEIHRIEQRAKDLSLIYSMIVIKRREQTKYYANNRSDQNFYETIVEHLDLVMETFFKAENYLYLREEIHRLLRTNIFNGVKRQRLNQQWKEKYPILQEKDINIKNVKTLEQKQKLANRIQKISTIPNQKIRRQFNEEVSNIKPIFMRKTACQSINCQSPLIALMIPSQKEKIFNFQEKFKQNIDNNMNFVEQLDLQELNKESISNLQRNTTSVMNKTSQNFKNHNRTQSFLGIERNQSTKNNYKQNNNNNQMNRSYYIPKQNNKSQKPQTMQMKTRPISKTFYE